jgi:predicted CoA-binding protein
MNSEFELAEQILRSASTIAVVGLSQNPGKAAHSVPAAMQAAGFRVISVHPSAERILGERAYRSLAEVPDAVDVVNVFRPAPEAPGVAEQAVAIGAKALWLQQDIISARARDIAEQAGLDYVEDQCLAVVRSLAGITKP